MQELSWKKTGQTIESLIGFYQKKQLNLSPGFQRDSVWNSTDRSKLIDSIIRNYPLPAIFLYRRHENGEIIYDVIDGKQRIESIFRFMGVQRNRYEARVLLPASDKPEKINFNVLKKRKLQHLLNGYELTTIEVDGELSQIIDLFVRINSTGKSLTSQEKRNAKYYSSELLKVANKLAVKYEKYFVSKKILSRSQITRMKHIELMSELLLSVHQGDPINKKRALDKVMESKSLNLAQIKRTRSKTISAINWVKRILPDIQTTRFNNISDFYTLVVLFSKFEDQKFVLNDKKRNKLALDILKALSTGIDLLRDKQKNVQAIERGQELYRDYLLTVQQATDEYNQRKHRENILYQLLSPLFEKKDSKRCFSLEQRRLLWNSTRERKCSNNNCQKTLTWHDFTIDHISPHSKGGRTELNNAALMCRICNSKKGNKSI